MDLDSVFLFLCFVFMVDLQRFELWSKQETTRLSTCLFCLLLSGKDQEANVLSLPYLLKKFHPCVEVPQGLFPFYLHLFVFNHGNKVSERCPARCTLHRYALVYCTSTTQQERNFLRQLLFCNPVQGLCYLSLHAYQTICLAVKTNPGP